jgi:hypothetical protein
MHCYIDIPFIDTPFIAIHALWSFAIKSFWQRFVSMNKLKSSRFHARFVCMYVLHRVETGPVGPFGIYLQL